jgi:hypothetical protein
VTPTTTSKQAEFHNALAAAGRSLEIPEAADAYGWLIGSWDLEVYDHEAEGGTRRNKGEVHFGWTLEGRAVQDVWIAPRRPERVGDLSKVTNLYGTTLRVWDPAIQAWRVTWINPVTGRSSTLIGRWSGKDVVQVGASSDGTLIRWSFTEITADSFHWIGEILNPDGKTWKLAGEFRAKRMNENR